MHLSTGSYNPITAEVYTDIGLLTCDEVLGRDASDLFNYLTGYSAKRDYQRGSWWHRSPFGSACRP